MTDTTPDVASTTLVDLSGPDASAFLAAFRAAAVARSTDQVRPLLTCVLLDVTPDDGCRLVATDSYRLAVATADVAIAPATALLPSELVVPLLKAATPTRCRRAGSGLALRLERVGVDLTATLTTGDGVATFTAREDEGTWPAYRSLSGPAGVGETGEQCVSAFNPAFLAGLADIARALDAPADTVPGRLVGVDALKPSTWTMSAGGVEVTYLLMPVRV